MSHTRLFNRHANMNMVTMTVINHLITSVIINRRNKPENNELGNMLYGLFDGYDYTDAIMEIANNGYDKFSDEYKFLKAICEEVKTYPDGETEI